MEPKVDCRVHKSLPLVPVPAGWIHSTLSDPIYLKLILILYTFIYAYLSRVIFL
jgi:hypothetical protein